MSETTNADGVWAGIVGQRPVVDMLRGIVEGDASAIAQSWLVCGPAGSGRSDVARAFAAALECPRHGCGACPTCRQILAGSYPDVTVLATDRVTISIDEVRELIATSEQMPSNGPWRVIIVEDVDRMLERTTNVLLKEIEEPAERTIWLLCAPSAQDVLPTIRSRCRIVSLAVPPDDAVAAFLVASAGVDPAVAERAARLAEGHIGVAQLYATNEQTLADRDELVAGVLALSRASDAVLLADRLIDSANRQAAADVERAVAQQEAEFRRINGLGERERIPPALRGAFNAIGKKDEVRRRTTRRSRDVLDRALTTVASVYRDVTVLQNDAEQTAGLVNRESRASIADLASRLDRQAAIGRLESIAVARRRLFGNGNPSLVFEALFCSLLA